MWYTMNQSNKGGYLYVGIRNQFIGSCYIIFII